MATGDVDITEGTGLKVATHTISEDAVTKHIQRVNINDSAGADILGSQADAASASTTVKGALRAIATALGVTALDLGVGTGGSRTLRVAIDTASQTGNVGNNADAIATSGDLLNTPVVSYLFGYNGTTYDRLQVDASKNLKVALESILTDDAAFTPGTTKVNVAGFQADEASTDSVNEGDAGAARMTLDRKQIMTAQPHSAGGLSVFRSLDLDETEEEVSAVPCCLYKLRITNRATSVRYVKAWNATAANVTVGTTTPIDTIPVPGNATDYTVLTESYGGLGVNFDTALTLAATTGFADNDTGAPGANDVIVSAYYK